MQKLKVILPLVFFLIFSCSEDDDSALTGKWMVETDQFTAEFKISGDKIKSGRVVIRDTSKPDGSTTVFVVSDGTVDREDNESIYTLHLSNGSSYLDLIRIKVTTFKTTMEGSAWVYSIISKTGSGTNDFTIHRQ